MICSISKKKSHRKFVQLAILENSFSIGNFYTTEQSYFRSFYTSFVFRTISKSFSAKQSDQKQMEKMQH